MLEIGKWYNLKPSVLTDLAGGTVAKVLEDKDSDGKYLVEIRSGESFIHRIRITGKYSLGESYLGNLLYG